MASGAGDELPLSSNVGLIRRLPSFVIVICWSRRVTAPGRALAGRMPLVAPFTAPLNIPFAGAAGRLALRTCKTFGRSVVPVRGVADRAASCGAGFLNP